MESHSSHQLSWPHLTCLDQSTCGRMVPWHFHSVHLEPSSYRLEQSDPTRGSGWRSSPTRGRSKPVSVMEHADSPCSGQTCFHLRCWFSPVLLAVLVPCNMLEPGAKSWWSYSPDNSSFWIASNHWDKKLLPANQWKCLKRQWVLASVEREWSSHLYWSQAGSNGRGHATKLMAVSVPWRNLFWLASYLCLQFLLRNNDIVGFFFLEINVAGKGGLVR